jgi:uncharacterized damage-inducible protein DinB
MQLTPEQVQLIFRFTLPTLRNEHQTTARVIRAIPAGKGEYRPDRFSRSASDLASHMAGVEIMFLRGVAEGQFPSGVSPDSNDPSAIADWYDAQFEQVLGQLQGLSPEQLQKTINFANAFNLPAFAYLTFAVNHSIHHRGQLSVYLRPMGGKVPAIYGESYDSANAK